MNKESAYPVHIIAELANTHEGDVERAKRVVDAVPDEADAVKVQAFTAAELMVPDHPAYNSLGEKVFSRAQWKELVGYIHDASYAVYADVFGTQSLANMADLDVDGYKIHSADMSNRLLLAKVANREEPVYLAAGGVTIQELEYAIYTLEKNGAEPAALIYGFQNYPTAFEETHLRKIQALRRLFDLPVGFAPHIDGDADIAADLPQWAVAAGADLVEIHITVDRDEHPTDYESSLTAADFETAVDRIRRIEPALGSISATLNDGEWQYRTGHKKYVTASEQVEADTKLTEGELTLKRIPAPPETALTDLRTAVGRVTTSGLSKHDPVTEDLLDENVVAVLACRARSDRLYGKPMQLLCDRPIIEHLIDRLELVEGINEIVLAIADTPDQHVFIDYARRNGHPYVVGDENDVLKRLIEGARATNAETVVRVTTENPFVYWENVDGLIKRHHERGSDLTTVQSMPSGTHVEIIDRKALEISHEEGEDRHRSELCTLYINENEDRFEVEKLDPPSELERPDIRLTIDYPSDLMVARRICDGLEDEEHPISLPRIVEFLDEHPEVREFNAGNPNETRLYE